MATVKELEISVFSVPPQKIKNRIKKDISEITKIFGENCALLYEPHITIRSSFKAPRKDLNIIFEKVREEFKRLKKPKIKIGNWEVFIGRDVYCIYLSIKNKKQIYNIFKNLKKLFKKYKKTFVIRKFDPHISLAWNLKSKKSKEGFRKAVEYLKKSKYSFKEEYLLNKIFLYEHKKKGTRLIKIIK